MRGDAHGRYQRQWAFQRMLENLLEPVRDCADPFVDDVIIASGDPSMSYEELLEAHERDVTRVLDLLVRHKLTGSTDKATIAVSEVVVAGYVVGNGQRKPIPGKPAAIEHWEKPKTVSELRAYLGFCNYYSGYIKMYAEYAAPMTTMLKGNREETKKGSKKALVWNDESDRAFEGMKQALLSAVGLHLVDLDRGPGRTGPAKACVPTGLRRTRSPTCTRRAPRSTSPCGT